MIYLKSDEGKSKSLLLINTLKTVSDMVVVIMCVCYWPNSPLKATNNPEELYKVGCWSLSALPDLSDLDFLKFYLYS